MDLEEAPVVPAAVATYAISPAESLINRTSILGRSVMTASVAAGEVLLPLYQ